MNRTGIPENIQRKLWSESSGRCQFRGCHEHLWYNSLTGKSTPFAQIAHIIGASKDGPRGKWNSPELQIDPDNLMLLCAKCHKEIDYGRNIQFYPPEYLREMKKENEERIRLLLDTPRNKTTVLKFTCQIKDRVISIAKESIFNAVLPNYPDSRSDQWHSIEIPYLKRDESSWANAKSIIDEEYEKLSRRVKNGSINYLSIFGIGPMPLLFYLGYKFGDTISGEVFHARGGVEPPNQFTWPNLKSNPIVYESINVRKERGKNVLLLLSLSDYLGEEKYKDIIDSTFSIYEIKIKDPSPYYLNQRSDLELFKIEFRKLLNEIQKAHGASCEIHLLPAVPACVAITAGRIILPTKDPKITIYESSLDKHKPEAVLVLN
jgi:hypothetical protein